MKLIMRIIIEFFHTNMYFYLWTKIKYARYSFSECSHCLRDTKEYACCRNFQDYCFELDKIVNRCE